jgi:hypothetical protein
LRRLKIAIKQHNSVKKISLLLFFDELHPGSIIILLNLVKAVGLITRPTPKMAIFKTCGSIGA